MFSVQLLQPISPTVWWPVCWHSKWTGKIWSPSFLWRYYNRNTFLKIYFFKKKFFSCLQRCYCAAGNQLHPTDLSCLDVDECTSPPADVCKHICINTRGSYSCNCHPGFYLEPDDKSCKTKGAVDTMKQSALCYCIIYAVEMPLVSIWITD